MRRHTLPGIRTFTLLGGMAGVAGWFWTFGFQAVAIVLLVGATALVVAAYVGASRRDVDGTTEVAALVVLSAGVLAGTGYLVLASAIVAITTLLLVEKSWLHSMIARINDAGLRAGVRFAVMAVVILPLLPDGPYGPLGGIRPRQLWLFVLLFSGLSFIGYVARRFVGSDRGFPSLGLARRICFFYGSRVCFCAHKLPGAGILLSALRRSGSRMHYHEFEGISCHCDS